MRRNNRKSQFSIPNALSNAEREWENIARTADKNAISDTVYKGVYKDADGKKRFEVRELLLSIYFNKCAYCEIKDFEPDVEHYRPKKRVKGLSTHPGYYWLCYEWTNLLPACRFCNTGKGKGNKFPIVGRRVSAPIFDAANNLDKVSCRAQNSPLINERAYLLHPEVDDPKPCFTFTKNGSIRGIDGNDRGRKTIEICDLNRENLKYRRQKILDNLVEQIEDILMLFLEERINSTNLKIALRNVFVKIENRCMPQNEFSLFTTYIKEHFNTMVLPLLNTPKQRTAVANAYQLFLEKKL